MRNSHHKRIELHKNGSGLMAYGCVFPSGTVMIEWNPSYWNEGERLSHDHHSIYGSVADVKKVTDCEVRMLDD